MSELKATTVYDAYWKANSVGEGTGIQVYLKSEADKVIAELEDKLQAANEQIENLINSASSIMLFQDRVKDDKCAELCHQKHKRCLAMAHAEWLKQMVLCNYPESILYRRAARRERKWKEMAQNFKEAK